MAKRTRRTVEEAQAAILDAAEEVLHEVGPAGLRVTAVAKRAGMAHPNVLHHFGTREGLLKALTTRTVERSTERAVRAIQAAVVAGPEHRTESLARVLDAVYEGEQGRLMAWLVLSRRVDDEERLDMEPLVQLTHAWRTSTLGPGDIDETRRLIVLSALAMLGDSIAGEGLVESMGLGTGEQGRRDFRAWLAGFLIEQIEGRRK